MKGWTELANEHLSWLKTLDGTSLRRHQRGYATLVYGWSPENADIKPYNYAPASTIRRGRVAAVAKAWWYVTAP